MVPLCCVNKHVYNLYCACFTVRFKVTKLDVPKCGGDEIGWSITPGKKWHFDRLGTDQSDEIGCKKLYYPLLYMYLQNHLLVV